MPKRPNTKPKQKGISEDHPYKKHRPGQYTRNDTYHGYLGQRRNGADTQSEIQKRDKDGNFLPSDPICSIPGCKRVRQVFPYCPTCFRLLPLGQRQTVIATWQQGKGANTPEYLKVKAETTALILSEYQRLNLAVGVSPEEEIKPQIRIKEKWVNG